MSRIGIQPIVLPDGVTVEVQGAEIVIKGAKGELRVALIPGLSISQEGNEVSVGRDREDKRMRAMHGTVRSLVSNAVDGVSKGFEKHLEIQGVGYRAVLEGQVLVLSLGFSHDIRYPIPEGIEVKMEGQTGVSISGRDKQLVGQVAARIRAYSPVEPYKGKGVRYRDEQVRRKVGKAVA